VPTLDITTHGRGVDGALAAAQELVSGWVAEKRARGEPVPVEGPSLLARIEIPDAVVGP
jgi:predicted RNase H-like HicB family nuclease